MAMHSDNMDSVKDQNENPTQGIWYHVKVTKVEEAVSKESNSPIIKLQLKIQDEPFVGRLLFANPSLQAHALFNLKAYYTGAEYFPGPEGHDPEKLLDREFYVKPTGKVVGGEERLEIKAHNIKPLRNGRPQ